MSVIPVLSMKQTVVLIRLEYEWGKRGDISLTHPWIPNEFQLTQLLKLECLESLELNKEGEVVARLVFPGLPLNVSDAIAPTLYEIDQILRK